MSFPNLYNWGNMNKNGTTYDMAWDAMGQEEVQYQINDADKSDISAIKIILHYWKSSNGNLMVKVTGLHVLGDYTVEAGDVKIDYPDTLVLYIMGSCIEVKSSRKSAFPLG